MENDINREINIKQVEFGIDIDNIEYSIEINPRDTFAIELNEQGPQGARGYTGNGIESYELTSTVGLTDTYTITFTDGNTTTVDVTNGRGITSITGPVSVGNVDTYTINYNDSTTSTFTVTNGIDGVNPTVTVGTTTTGNPGTNASVVNSGTAQDVVLDFTIPRGDKGETGEDGADGFSPIATVSKVGDTATISITDINGTTTATISDGTDGIDGQDGQAATITVGTVTTGLPTDPASVTNVGTSSAAIFDFTIPKGDKGDTGSTGATGNGIVDIELVSTSGLIDTYNVNYTNGTHDSFTVTNGKDGTDGTDGVDGTAATIAVGTVTTGPAGSSASVINSGTSSAAVFDFTIPKGDKGDTGDTGPQGVSVTGVTLISTVGLQKTYRMSFSNGTYYDYIVSDGAAGATTWGGITGVLSNQTDLQNALDLKANISSLATVATSGSYNDLTDKPTIPTVNNAMLTIQKNGTTVDTFTANASSNVTVNITVPTDTIDLTNGAGYITGITSGDVTTALGYTPYNSTNPNGYISGITSGDVTTTLGYTPLSNSTKYGADLDYTSNTLQLLDQDGNDLGSPVTIQSSPDIDNKSITTNSDDELQTIAVIDQNNTSNAIKTWTGTKAQYDAIVTKDTNTQYTCTDSGEIYLGTDLIANKAGNRNIGEIIQSTIPLTDAGLHLLDGALINGSGIYADFVTYIAGLETDYPDLFETEANWQSAVTTYGVCGKFVYDSVNNTVRLPKYNSKIYTGGGTVSVTSATQNNELFKTADTGVVTTLVAKYNDAYTTSILGSPSISGQHNLASNMIANLANITTSLDGYYYIVIATTTKTEIEVDIDEIATDLNGKADVDLTNLSNTGNIKTAHNAMPSSTKSIPLTLGSSGASYTAPTDGYVYINKIAASSGQYIQILSTNIGVLGRATGNVAIQEFLPVKKGDSFIVNYNAGGATNTFVFVPCVGSESEAS